MFAALPLALLLAVAPVPDPLEDPANPLDVRQVSFEQHDTQLELKLRTQGEWSAGDAPICLHVSARTACVAAEDGKAVLRVGGRTIAVASRRDRRSFTARFTPRQLGVGYGTQRWHIEGPGDRVPNAGEQTVQTSVLAQPRCFGAAGRLCSNPDLRTSVVPAPDDAVWQPGASCVPRRDRTAVLHPCEFGDRRTSPLVKAALIGDSHADHWRATVAVVAAAKGWRAVSMTRAGCSFSVEAYPGGPSPASCVAHSNAAIRWLRAHPSVHTVFTSSSAGRGLSAAGYQAIWRRLPASVRHVYVLRDVPRMRVGTGGCVSRVLERHAPTVGICGVPRGAALIGDTSASAAAGMGGRVRLVDLTRMFCDAARCFPVVGGAYVYKDDNHMNATFGATLGPFLLRRLG